jgi:hypothetical protein
MRFKRIVGVIGLCLCASGCRLAADVTHNMVFETCLLANDVKAKVYYPALARSAWTCYLADHPGLADSPDFARGFKLGYADYLENGGDGSGRALPPMRYWKIRNETPEGRAATQQWLAGFRQGQAAARTGGKREMVVVPIDAAPPPPPNVPPSAGPPLAPPTAPATPPITPPPPTAGEELPRPQALPPTSFYQTDGDQKPAKPAETPRPAATSQPAAPSAPSPAPSRPNTSASAAPADPDLPRIITGGAAKDGTGGTPSPLPNISSGNKTAPPTPAPGNGARGEAAPPTPAQLQKIASRVQRIEALKSEKTPRDPEPHYQVGMVALRAGATAEALRWFNTALQEDPNHAPTHRALKEYYESVGDFRRAAEHRVLAEMHAQDRTNP